MGRVTNSREYWRLFFGKILLFVKSNGSNGFTLIELIAGVAILGILSVIGVVSVIGVIDKSESEVCNVNSRELERFYEAYLNIENVDHSSIIFSDFLKDYDGDVCPVGGDILYVEGMVECSVHSIVENGDGDGGVPYL